MSEIPFSMSEKDILSPNERYQRFFAAAGMVFVALAFFCFAAIVVIIIIDALRGKIPSSISDVLSHLILLATGFLSALIARGLLTAGEASSYSSFPERDLKLIKSAIKKGEEDPITQYIRVRSLSGFTGGFTKIGLTGLPLVTISVTMIFTLAALIFFKDEKIFTSLFDLAKLTLGAFIGSYVQRQVEQRKQAAEATAAGRRPPPPDVAA